jgi:LPXTG-motif cell wall-anchored protein
MAKRVITVVVGTLGFLLVPALAAVAQQYPPNSNPGGGGTGSTGPTLPFTGASISAGMIILVALIAVGMALLLVARRRRKTAAAA